MSDLFSRRLASRRRAPLVALAGLALAALGGACAPDRAPQGVVLVNLSGLRLDALGSSGRSPSPTPVLDALAENALVYSNAWATSSGPLAGQVSLLTGLFPQEHGVFAPDRALSADVPTLAERFADFGYRTAGFSGGGYALPELGIDRGFDEYVVQAPSPGSTAVPAFEGALDYLRSIGSDRFFVYLAPGALSGAAIFGRPGYARLSAGFEELTPERVADLWTGYSNQLRTLDSALGAFVEGLGALGLQERTILVVTADRAFELGEHGRVGNQQLYPESLKVPLLVSLPGDGLAVRRDGLVQTLDVPATLFQLAGIPAPPASGRVLPGLPGSTGPRTWGAAERRGRWQQESLLLETENGLRQLVRSRLRGEYDGTWVTRRVAFDTDLSDLEFRIVSYLEPRSVSVRVDGGEFGAVEAGLGWAKTRFELPEPAGARRRVELVTESCASPSDHGSPVDRRCLSFKLDGLNFETLELFELGADPEATRDLSFDDPALVARLVTAWAERRWLATPRAERVTLPTGIVQALVEAGEFPEPPRPTR